MKMKSKKIEKDDDDDVDDDDDDVVDKYGFDDYDDDDQYENPLENIAGLTYYTSNSDDPYITLKDEEDSDEEDYIIKPTDNLLLAPRVKKDHCIMEVYVYSDNDGAVYVHHDFLLSGFPLAVEWMNFDPGEDKPGNFCALGTMEPVIDIWDLDLVDSIEPSFTLGQKLTKKKKKKVGSVGGHTDAVLSLSWNKHVRNVLASGSADETIALWDMTQGKIVKTLKQHKDKVQALEFHPCEAQTLLSGGFDKIVNLFDCRSPDSNNKHWQLDGEIENITWNNFSPFHALASTDKGFVYLLDVRTDKTIFTLSAHTSAVTGLSLSSQVPGLLVTGSTDKTLKVWDIQDNKPALVYEKILGQGEILCTGCCPDAPYCYAVGSEKDLSVLDIREDGAVQKHFGGRTAMTVTTTTATTTTAAESGTEIGAMATLNLSEPSQPASKSKKRKKKLKKPAK